MLPQEAEAPDFNPRRVFLVHTGNQLGDVYSQRVVRGIQRHLSGPMTLTLLTDRRRDVPPEVRQQFIEGPPMTGFWNKLLLYSPEVLAGGELFFMDLTLVIKGSLNPFLEFADACEAPIIAVHDFRHGGLNSCVLRIRPGVAAQTVWDAYQRHEMEPGWQWGDQDFTAGVLKKYGMWDQLAFFPDELVISYRRIRELYRRQPLEAMRKIAAASVIKFHGHPRPHHVVSPWFPLISLKSYPHQYIKNVNFLRKEIKRWWR